MKPRKARTQQPKQDRRKAEPQEPILEDCRWCGGAHLLGTVHLCPLAPKVPPQPQGDGKTRMHRQEPPE